MSIYIKGMKMPASCAGCYMFLHGLTMDGHPWQECAVTDSELKDPFGCGKPDSCTITEMQPHGRLVEAEQIVYESIIEGQRSKRYKLGEQWELNLSEIFKVVDRLKTVIEEDGGE